MRLGRYLCILGCVAALGAAAPRASAAPTEQVTVGAAVVDPVLQTQVLPAVQQVLPYTAIQQTPLQFIPLPGNTYVVSHPGLYWSVDQTATAHAAVQQMARAMAGWDTLAYTGPYGYGLYPTYQPVANPVLLTGVLPAVQQFVPDPAFDQTPLQLLSLQNNVYLVSHPGLYWRTDQAPAALVMARQLASVTPGWGTTTYGGPLGYGVYLTYRYG